MPREPKLLDEINALADSSPALKTAITKRKSNSFTYLFFSYWKWLKGESGFDWVKNIETPDQLIQHYDNLPTGKPKYVHLDAITSWLNSTHHIKTSSSSKSSMLTAIRSFYKANRSDLPKETTKFIKSDLEKERISSQTPIDLTELRNIITRGNVLERAVLLTCFQAGLGVGEFEEFNMKGYTEEFKQLLETNETPLIIKLHRPKTDNVYYSFLSKDAVNYIKLWLGERERMTGQPIKLGEPIFLVLDKKHSNREGSERSRKEGKKQVYVPVKEWTVQRIMRSLAHEVGAEFRKEFDLKKYSSVAQIRYKYHPHELRDVFKSVCTLSGVNPIASEWFLGHEIDKLGYDKSPFMDVQFFKKEYTKSERLLNLVSTTTSQEDYGRLESVIEELREENRRLKEAMSPENIKKLLLDEFKRFTSESLIQVERDVRTEAHREVLNRFARRTREKQSKSKS